MSKGFLTLVNLCKILKAFRTFNILLHRPRNSSTIFNNFYLYYLKLRRSNAGIRKGNMKIDRMTRYFTKILEDAIDAK